MKYLILFLLTSCGGISRLSASLTGSDEVCYKGVSYIQFTSGVTVKYNKDGTINTCE